MGFTNCIFIFLLLLIYNFQVSIYKSASRSNTHDPEVYISSKSNCDTISESDGRNISSNGEKTTLFSENGQLSFDVPTSKLSDMGKFEKNQYDYPDIIYPVPFNKLYNDISYRYENYGKPNPKLPSFVLTGDIPSVDAHNSDVLVMTGASSNHGHGSFNLIYSALFTDPHASILYIDLGLSDELLDYLNAHFETWKQIQSKLKSNGFLAYRRINWENYPEWMHLSYKGIRGGYSFKPIAIFDGITQWKGLFTWLDGGNVITDSFTREFTYARRYGFYAPFSNDDIARWTHPKMITFLEGHNLINKVNKRKKNCSSGIMFYDWSKPYVHEMVRLFADCGYTRKCISPEGATLANHRFDQALATLLIHHYQIPRAADPNYTFQPSLRNEGQGYHQILKNLIVGFRHAYHINLNNTKYDFSSFKYGKVTYGYIRRKFDF